MDVENAFLILHEAGHIKYGHTIEKETLENIIGLSYDPKSWEWIGALLQLKKYIEEQGYFCTQRKCPDGCMRIMHVHEMPHKVDNLQETIRRKQAHAINSMKHADTSELKDRERAEFYHELHKATLGLKALNSVLYNIN